MPRMSCGLRALVAWFMAEFAAHFQPDPAWHTHGSFESLNVARALQFATLNSSTTDDNGIYSSPDLMLRPTGEKHGGNI